MEYCVKLLEIIERSKNPKDIEKAVTLLTEVPNLELLVDENGANLLHNSAIKGNLKSILYLLYCDFDINARTNDRYTPLMLAVMHDQEGAACLLIEKNAEINFYKSPGVSIFSSWRSDFAPGRFLGSPVPRAMVLKVVEGFNTIVGKGNKLYISGCPLCMVAQLESHEIIDYILTMKQNIITEERNILGITASDVVVFKYDSTIKQNIIAEELSILGITALHVAVFKHDLQSVKLLLKRGANVNVPDDDGKTPLMYLNESQNGRDEHLAILKVLLERGATLQKSVSRYFGMPIEAVFMCSKEAIGLVLEKGIDFSARDNQLRTPLHYLAENQNPDVMEVVKDQNVIVNALDSTKTSALYYASRWAHISSVRFLLSLGATVDTIDLYNLTPLAGSVIRSKPDFECAELLLQRGANAQKLCIFKAVKTYESFDQILPVLLHLATLEACGGAIKNKVMKKIRSHDQFLKPFKKYKSLLEQWKIFKPCNTVSLFELYTASVQRLSIYLRNDDLALQIKRWNTRNNQATYLHRRLRQRFVEAFRLMQLKKQAANSLSTIMGLTYVTHFIIINMILGYLSEIDWQQLVRVFNDTIRTSDGDLRF